MNDYFVELVSLFAGFFRICVDKLLIHAVMCSWRYEMEPLFFVSSEDFENWLDTNHQTSEGVWIKFDKSKNNTRLTNQEAVRVLFVMVGLMDMSNVLMKDTLSIILPNV